MPSQRKRIGFLPRTEIQNIIYQISKHNKLSQSKVTGILVEEALKSRGVLNGSINKLSLNFDCNNSNYSFIHNNDLNNEKNKMDNNLNLNESYIKDEVQMINDFIEFKFFKKMMNNNKNYK